MDPLHSGQQPADETRPPGCPSWCVSAHGALSGEEDWVHESEPLRLADGVLARLRMSVNPRTRGVDGPFVYIGSEEHTAADARSLAASLLALAAKAR